MPYAHSHPVHLDHTLRIELPADWDFSPVSHQAETPAFRFSAKSSSTPRSLTLRYLYHSKAPAVPPKDIATHIETCKAARNEAFYQICFDKSLRAPDGSVLPDSREGASYSPSGGSTEDSGPGSLVPLLITVIAVLSALLLLALLFLVLALTHRRPKPPIPPPLP